MKHSNEKLYDPKLRAFVAKKEYVEAMRYFRAQYNTSRAEAAEVIDLVRAILEQERERGASGKIPEAWAHPTKEPQRPKPAEPRFDEPEQGEEPDQEETEEPQRSDDLAVGAEELPEEEAEDDAKDEDFNNQNPYAYPEQDKFIADDDEEELDELEDLDEEGFLEEAEEEQDAESDNEPSEEAAPTEPNNAPPEPLSIEVPPESTPTEEAPSIQNETPVEQRISDELRAEVEQLLRDGQLESAIRFYWRETGCSLQEAKVIVSSWGQRRVN